MTQIATTLPDVLVGPLLRRLSPSRLILWLVATRPLTMQLVLNPEQEEQQTHALDNAHQRVAIGRHAYIHRIDLSLPTALPTDTALLTTCRYKALMARGSPCRSGRRGYATMTMTTQGLCWPLATTV